MDDILRTVSSKLSTSKRVGPRPKQSFCSTDMPHVQEETMKTPILICLFLLAIPMGNARSECDRKDATRDAYVDLCDFESKIRELFKAVFAKQNVSMVQADV
jgi:hypothetical protein